MSVKVVLKKDETRNATKNKMKYDEQKNLLNLNNGQYLEIL